MAEKRTALIFGAVPAADWSFLKERCPAPDVVICADGGVRCARSAGYTPDLAVGDWDSNGAIPREIPVMTLPEEKDLTDLQAAAGRALEMGCTRMILTACLGGRLDQSAASLGLLEWVYDRGGEASVLGEGDEVRFWDGAQLTLRRDSRYRFLSLLPLDRSVEGVELEGVKYPLYGARLTRGDTLSVSNEIVARTARLRARSGRMLLIQSRKRSFFSGEGVEPRSSERGVSCCP